MKPYKKVIGLILFISVFEFILSASIFAAELVSKEYWTEVFICNQKVGYYHYKVEPGILNGEDIYNFDVRFSSMPDESGDFFKEYQTIVTDKELKLKSCDKIIKNKEEEISIKAVKENGKLSLTINRNGYVIERIIAVSEDVYSDFVLTEKIAIDKLNIGEHRFKVFDEEKLVLLEKNIKILESSEDVINGKTTRIIKTEEKDNVYKDIIVKKKIAEDGTLLTLQSDELNYLILKSAKLQAESRGKVEPLLPPRTLPFDTCFLRPEDVTYLKIEMKLERPEAIDAVFLDTRQSLSKIDDTENAYFLSLESAANDISSIPLQEVPADSLKPYLADSVYLNMNDPAIIKLATELTAENKDTISQVKNISKWIQKNIQPEITGSFLSAKESIEAQKGDCSECSILFCALARCLGIPTKMVVGVSYAFGALSGHMWNEVYVDNKWIPVDSTINQVGIDAVHIKFLETDFDYASLMLLKIQYLRSYLIREFKVAESKGTPSVKWNEIFEIPVPTLEKLPEQVMPVISPEDIKIEAPIRIVVAKLTNNTNDKELRDIEYGLCAFMKRNLMCVQKFSILSWTLDSEDTDLTKKKEEDLDALCKKCGVEFIIFGEINKNEDTINLTLKVYDSLKQEIVLLTSWNLNKEAILKCATEAVLPAAEYFNIKLSSEEIEKINSGHLPPFDALWAFSIARRIEEMESNPAASLLQLAYLQLALKIDPNFSAPYADAGELLQGAPLIGQSYYEWFNKAIMLDPYNAEIYWRFNLALIHSSEDRKQIADDAIVLLKKSLAISPGFGRSHLSLSGRYREKEMVDLALDELKKAETITPVDPYVYEMYSAFYVYNKVDYDKGITYAQKWRELDPTEVGAYYKLAECYFEKGQYEQAIAALTEAIKLEDDIKCYTLLGNSYYEMRKFEKAREVFLEALEIEPKDTYLHVQIALTYEKEKNYPKAISRCEKAIEIDPHTYNVHNLLGCIYMDVEKNYEKAIKEFELEIKYHPENSVPYVNLANAYRAVGRNEDAFKAYRKTSEPDPSKSGSYVKCNDNNYSYIVQLPPDYNEAKKWPVLFCFDPSGRGDYAAQLFSAAKDYGWVVIGVMDAQNGPWEPIKKVQRAILTDVIHRYSVDKKRLFAAGCLGGARMAYTMAYRYPKSFRGVIACGAGPGEGKVSKEVAVFHCVKKYGINYKEVKSFSEYLIANSIKSELKIFDGEYEWPPEKVIREALEWMSKEKTE